MTNIRFRFDREKLVAVLTFFASRMRDLDVLKASKLLYYTDKRHLLRYGRPVTGDDYFGMDHGPVPERSYDIIKAVLKKNAVMPPDLAQYLDVDASTNYPRFVAKAEPDMEVLSETDVEVLEEVVREFGGLGAMKLRDLTHKEPEVKESDEKLKHTSKKSVPIPFAQFFDSERDRSMKRSVEATQSDRDFADLLS